MCVCLEGEREQRNRFEEKRGRKSSNLERTSCVWTGSVPVGCRKIQRIGGLVFHPPYS